MDLGRIVIRGVVGPLFVGHGSQKLFGWFEGGGLEGTAGFLEGRLGLKPGKAHAAAAGLSEAGGGALLALGALTPVAAAMLTGTMLTAMRTAHAGKGPWASSGGWEYPLVLIGAAAAIAQRGPGTPSVDAKLLPNFKGTRWAAAALAAGALGSVLATATREPQPAEA